MEESIEVNKEKDLVDLPPGFRFHPTDEEIITHYLTQKAVNCSFTSSVIGEIDLNKCEPWDMPSKPPSLFSFFAYLFLVLVLLALQPAINDCLRS